MDITMRTMLPGYCDALLHLGRRIRLLREDARLTQHEVAKMSGIGRQTIMGLEAPASPRSEVSIEETALRWNPTLETMVRLARVLGTDVHGLFKPAEIT